MILEIQFWGYG